MALQKGKQWTRPPLAFIRYYDSHVANDWRRHNGDKAQSAASKDRQLKESKNGCAMLEACHTYGKGLAKFPWVAVIEVQDIGRVVSFGPIFQGMGPGVEMFYLYDAMLQPSALSAMCVAKVKSVFKL